MRDLKINSNPEVSLVFEKYPDKVLAKMRDLRNLIIEVAESMEEITSLQETLKWNEPSYLTKIGSTIRIDWKVKKPNQYAMYFQCTSKLIPTFRLNYDKTFAFEGSRAIIFQMHEEIPKTALKKCIETALKYHKVKHLPALGM